MEYMYGVTRNPYTKRYFRSAADYFRSEAEDQGKNRMMGSGEGAKVAKDHLWYSGRITVDPSVKLPAKYTIYVSAGYPPKGRPPVLSRRYDMPSFPLDFELRQEHQAFGNAKMDTPLVLYLTMSESGVIPMGPPPPGFGEYWKSPLSAAHAPESKGLSLVLKPRK